MEKCAKCGCPEFDIDIITHQYHYKRCPEVRSAYQKRKVSMADLIAGTKDWIGLLKRQVRHVEKIIGIDEVYECRWDCYFVPG